MSYADLVQLAREDPRLLGIVLSGSRGRGAGRPESDWDAYLIVADDAVHALDSKRDRLDPMLDLSVMSLADFETYAEPGTDEAWEAYAFVHADVAHDRLGGRIAEIAAAKEFLSEDLAARAVLGTLDAYINAAVRAAKDRRDGLFEASILDSAEAVEPVLETMFALEARIRPYNRYLSWELERHPLTFSHPSAGSLSNLIAAVTQGDADAHADLFHLVEGSARSLGWDEVLNGWDEAALSLVRTQGSFGIK